MTTSIRSRFFFSIVTNMLRGVMSFTTGVLLARWLGAESYGAMAFLLGAFVAIRQLQDMGSASAFFTFLSQKPQSKRFIRSFYIWLAVQFIVPFIAIGLFFPSRWIEVVWHGENRILVLLAYAAGFMQGGVWPVIQKTCESQRQTFLAQGIGTMVAAVHLLAIMLLWWLGVLGLYAIFAATVLEYLIAAVIVHQRYAHAMAGEAAVDTNPESLFRKYLRYCLPMVPFTSVGFVYEFADRWLLQKYGGGIEQAYYAVGAQFAGVALIATTSILSIFWKEIAVAHHQGNHERMGVLYQKVSRLLFFVGAIIAGFLIPWTEELLQLTLGAAYAGGATTLMIMFLYPVHQSIGQITNTMLYATERVSIQVITGIVFMVAGVGVTYFVLAPRDSIVPGLGLASTGLAIKMFLMQLIQVNILAYIISRIWRWPFYWVYQPILLLGCVGLGWLAHTTAKGIVSSAWSLLALMGLGGLFYLLLMAVFVYAMPRLAGLTRDELMFDIDEVRRIIMGGSRLN